MNFVFSNGKRKVGGTAALLHKIKGEGGYDTFMKNRECAAIASFLNSPDYREMIEKTAEEQARRNKIKMKSSS